MRVTGIFLLYSVCRTFFYAINAASVENLMSEIYVSKKITALRVGPLIPQTCNVSNHGNRGIALFFIWKHLN